MQKRNKRKKRKRSALNRLRKCSSRDLFKTFNSGSGRFNMLSCHAVTKYPLGETFFIHWFTDPPTVNIQKVEKK